MEPYGDDNGQRVFARCAKHSEIFEYARGKSQLLVTIHKARHALRMKVRGPLAVAVGAAAVFDYFDEIRGIITEAKQDLLFVDPYLDAEFVTRYLPHVASGTQVRLLARKSCRPYYPPSRCSSSSSTKSRFQFDRQQIFTTAISLLTDKSAINLALRLRTERKRHPLRFRKLLMRLMPSSRRMNPCGPAVRSRIDWGHCCLRAVAA